MATDRLQRFLFSTEDVRGAHVVMSSCVHQIMQQHQYPPPIRRILGECLVVCTLLAHSIKIPGDLSIELRSKSKIKLLVANCNNQLQVRGLAQWENEVNFEDLPDVMREGDLVVTMMPDKAIAPLQSIVKLTGGDVATAFEHYFFQSEQLPTAIRLQVSDDSAAGFILQQMPQTASTEDIWSRFRDIIHSTSNDAFTDETQALLSAMLPEHDMELFETVPVEFSCHCSRGRMENAIRTVGLDEAQCILNERQKIGVRCEYCSVEYDFDQEDVNRIFADSQ